MGVRITYAKKPIILVVAKDLDLIWPLGSVTELSNPRAAIARNDLRVVRELLLRHTALEIVLPLSTFPFGSVSLTS